MSFGTVHFWGFEPSTFTQLDRPLSPKTVYFHLDPKWTVKRSNLGRSVQFCVILKLYFSLKNNQSRRNLLTYQNECELNEDELSLVTSTNWNRSIDLTFDRTKPGLRFGQIGKSHRLEFKFKNSKRLFTIGSLSTLSSNQWNENHILYPSE